MKKINSIILCIAFFIVFSCNSQQESKDQKDDNSSDSDMAVVSNDLINDKIEGGNRLSEEAMASYLPESFGKLTKSGKPKFSEADPRMGFTYTRMTQVYYGDEGNINLMVVDHADDQKYINDLQKGIEIQNYPTSKTYKNDKGLYVTESFEYRTSGEDTLVTSRTLSMQNPRFTAELKASSKLGEEAPSSASIRGLFEKSKLPQLFTLEIPQGDILTQEIHSDMIALDCENILLVDILSKTCGVTDVKVVKGFNEKETNCSRTYSSKAFAGHLIFLLSQYAEKGAGKSAVDYHINDKEIEARKINGLGETAVLQTVGEDLYLSVAHGRYLIELRSFKDTFESSKECCMCYGEDNLKALAQEVIERLPE